MKIKSLVNKRPLAFLAGFAAVSSLHAQCPLSSIRVSEVEICWTSESNALYRVDYRSDFTTNMWLPLFTNIVGSGDTMCIADKVPHGQPQRFYRVVSDVCQTQPELQEANCVNGSVLARFSARMDASSVQNTNNYVVTNATTRVTPFSAWLQGDRHTVQLDFGAVFLLDTPYTLVVSDVRDESGNVIRPNSSYTFRCGF
jgi:hypothetical protein